MILTGGKSSRFGSDKSRALLGPTSLLNHLFNSLPEDLGIVVVGPALEVSRERVQFVVENPLGGGPVAAIAAGLPLVASDYVAILATDMPFASRIVEVLMRRTTEPTGIPDGIVPLDSEGIRQPLCALYRTTSLRGAFSSIGKVEGQSMRNLTALLELEEMEIPAPLEGNLLDIDTQEDLARAITLSEKINSEKR